MTKTYGVYSQPLHITVHLMKILGYFSFDLEHTIERVVYKFDQELIQLSRSQLPQVMICAGISECNNLAANSC